MLQWKAALKAKWLRLPQKSLLSFLYSILFICHWLCVALNPIVFIRGPQPGMLHSLWHREKREGKATWWLLKFFFFFFFFFQKWHLSFLPMFYSPQQAPGQVWHQTPQEGDISNNNVPSAPHRDPGIRVKIWPMVYLRSILQKVC